MPQESPANAFEEFKRLHAKEPLGDTRRQSTRLSDGEKSKEEDIEQSLDDTTRLNNVKSQAIDDAKRLLAKYRSELALDEDRQLDTSDLSAWFYVRAELMKLCPVTNERYRRGIVALVSHEQPDIQTRFFPLHLAQIYARYDSRAQPLLSPDDQAAQIRSRRTKKKYRGGKLVRQKFCSSDQFAAILDHLDNRARSELAVVASAFLKAQLATGLRPSEWRASSMRNWRDFPGFNSEPCLDVLTPDPRAQNDGQVVLRSLDLKNLPSRTLDAISLISDRASATFRRSDREWDTLRTRLSELIDRACVAAFGKNGPKFALETFRHQFLANYAQGGATTEQVAAIAGNVDLLIGKNECSLSGAAWARESCPASARPSSLDQRAMEAFSTAYKIHKANYLELIDGRNVAITKAQLEKRMREGSLDF